MPETPTPAEGVPTQDAHAADRAMLETTRKATDYELSQPMGPHFPYYESWFHRLLELATERLQYPGSPDDVRRALRAADDALALSEFADISGQEYLPSCPACEESWEHEEACEIKQARALLAPLLEEKPL